MKYIKHSAFFLISIFAGCIIMAQGPDNQVSTTENTVEIQIIPDKLLEIGIPLLALFLLLNILVAVMKNRADHQLKVKMLEKGISEEALQRIFHETNAMAKLQPLKWFLFALAAGLSLVTIHLFRNTLQYSSGYLPLAVFLLFFSLASFIYYRIISKIK